MATTGSPLANVLKRSLTVTATLGESVSWWSEAAKNLHAEYAKLVALHDSIQKELKEDWKDLATQFDSLVAKMQKLEAAKVGTDETERKNYTAQVTAVIKQADTLSKSVQSRKEADKKAKAEEERRQADEKKRLDLIAGQDYKTASEMLETAMDYAAANDAKGNRDFSQISQWIKWRDTGNPTMGQVTAIIEGYAKIKGVVDPWSKQQKSNKEAEAQKQKEDEARKKAAEEKDRQRREKEAASETERQKRIGPARELLKAVLAEVKDELADFSKLDSQLDGFQKTFAADRKYSVYEGRVKDLRKTITNEARQVLGAQTPTLKDVLTGLQKSESDLDKMDAEELDALSHKLPKVRESVDNFEDKRTADGGYADQALALDPAAITKPASATTDIGYVYTDDLGTAEKYKKDMIGILAGARAGRTSPNGKANHIHVGGDANNNVIFDRKGPGGAVRILGFVEGHMDKRMAPTIRTAAGQVEDRASSTSFTKVEVDMRARTFKTV